MAERTVSVFQPQTKPIKIVKLKVKIGTVVSIGYPLLIYNSEGNKKEGKLKSTQAGTVHLILVKEGQVVQPGEILVELKACSHPTIMNDMCAECGADLRKNDDVSTASVPMIHAIPDLKVSEELALKLGKADNERLLKDRKLVLLVDLDQTLIHTTNDNIPPNIKDVYHFQLHGPNSPWYHTRLRPGTHRFLNNIHNYYELHICTFGSRNYAHTIAMFLDADQNFFSNRILSRDECFDPTSKKANLKALFPCGDNMVCIIDDREDVWSHATNLIHVKPYHFFQHTGDINAPPGLDKHENDKLDTGYDLTNIDSNSTINDLEITEEQKSDKPDKEVKETFNNDGEKEGNGDKIETLNKNSGTNNNEENNIEKDLNHSDTSDKTNISEELLHTNNENPEISEDKPLTETKKPMEIENPKEIEKPTEIEIPREIEKPMEIEKPTVIEKPTDDEKPTENSAESVSEKVPVDQNNSPQEQKRLKDGLIEIDDPDDYLIYLEEILKQIHDEFYSEYDHLESGEVPDLKQVIPKVRSNVLMECNLVFSGLVPTHVKLEQSKAFQVARGLGANVTSNIEDATTHLVAVRPGTAKVNSGKRKKKLKIVTPDWLWCCAERWEHVDERIFPLNRKGSKNRHPPPHCSSPEHNISYPEHGMPEMRKRTPSGKFMDTINPLMSFSSDDIADMDKEVEDILDDDSDSSEDEATKKDRSGTTNDPDLTRNILTESSSSEDSLTAEYPRGYKRKKCFQSYDQDFQDFNSNSEGEDESPSVKFRRGECVDDMLDYEQEDTQGSMDPPDEVDDGEWNMMGAALEREFLSNN